MVVPLKAEIRKEFGKEKMKKIRAAGKLPAVAYGPALKEPLHLALDMLESQKVLLKSGRETDYELKVGRKKYRALLQEVQRDPVSGNLMHVDFYLPPKRK
jgi:large subunit ribosomal protein L25